jgi:hypothetical protein
VRPLQAVVPDELGEYRPEMLLVEDDEAVQAFSTWHPHEPFDGRIRARAGYRRGDGIDTDPSGPLAEVVSVHRVVIMEQMARRGAQGVISITSCHTQAAVRVRGVVRVHQFRRP